MSAPPAPDKAPSLLANWVSVAGGVLAASSFFAVACLIALDFTSPFENPYMGILTYLVAPGFLIAGLTLMGAGALNERRRRRRLAPGVVPPHPRLDFNIPSQRNAAIVFLGMTFAFLLMTALGSYKTYHFTESVQFCGVTCHAVMKPEFTAYKDSPHARVACVQCHIGPGADWFVRSKLSGSYQVYATLAKKYPRPIPTPIENLRPAQDTCEQCHWPSKAYATADRLNRHFMADAKNSPWSIRLLMKVGGGEPEGGIHWHVSNTVEYIPADEKRQVIPWVRVTGKDGTVVVYEADEGKLTPEQVAKARPRRMDCIDCHNRPAHNYLPPSRAVNLALAAGRIDPKIPNVKRLAVEALTAEYKSTEEALAAIAKAVPAAAVPEVQKIYQRNFFPEMLVSWKAYPNNLGHTIFPGCYRCHDGKHASAGGKTITRDCRACHTIISQGAGPQARTISPQGLDFQHPVDIGDAWKEMNCADCHTGALAQ